MPMSMDEMFELRAQIAGDLRRDDKRIRNRTKKIGRMHTFYGAGPDGARCGDCASFIGGRYKKCKRFGDTRGPGTDWQTRWPACGRFEVRGARP